MTGFGKPGNTDLRGQLCQERIVEEKECRGKLEYHEIQGPPEDNPIIPPKSSKTGLTYVVA